MATLVCFHAHPDDEAIATAGTMAAAAAAGHRVVLVCATRGEHGEVVDGVLDDGEQLGIRRTSETHEAAAHLGADRVDFLGYLDSGMMGEPENDHPGSFWQADVEEAAHRLAAILRHEEADVLTAYDDHGGYGHPDHIQVHRVGVRAAELAGTPRVFEATMNRTRIIEGITAQIEAGLIDPDEWDGPDPTDPERSDFGSPEEIITHGIDVTGHLDAKRAAMAAHASQIGDDHFFLAMDDETFATAMGTEWFIEHGVERAGAPLRDDLFV
ncbi:MAG: PIG-L family deacetylase [Actinomycetota bacterium]